jgi:hypothetical protein
MKIFWSYARRDDPPPARKVSRLRGAFATMLSQVRGEDCEVHFDALSLKWGVEWRTEIERLIGDSDGLVAIVTPSYFNSRMSIFELQMAAAAGKKILPIYFRTCKQLRSSFKEDGVEAEINQRLNKASLKIGRVQMKDFRELRNESPDSKQVEDFLDAIAEQLA